MSTSPARPKSWRPSAAPSGLSARGAALLLLALLALVAPASLRGQEPSRERPGPTPFTVAPRLLNMEDVREALVRAYTREMRDQGITGTATIWFFIDEEGRVDNTMVNESSGHPRLDEAALRVASVYRFSPAMNRDERVPVWVSLPISFQLR